MATGYQMEDDPVVSYWDKEKHRQSAAWHLWNEACGAFKTLRLREAVKAFDALHAAHPSARSFLWARGIALYYLRRFDEAVAQFEADLHVNSNDAEESLWLYLCQIASAQLPAPPLALTSPDQHIVKKAPRFPDPPHALASPDRPIIEEASRVYAGTQDVSTLLIGHDHPRDFFYGHLYGALYLERRLGLLDDAWMAMSAARDSDYCRNNANDFMCAVAKLHCELYRRNT